MKKQLKNILKTENIDFDLDTTLHKFAQESKLQIDSYVVKRILIRPFSLVMNISIFNGQQQNIFVKHVKPQKFRKNKHNLRQEYEITRYWFERLKSHTFFHTVEPLWMDSEGQIIITRETDGVNLLSFLEQHIKLFPSKLHIQKATEYLTQAGNWLAYFQQQTIKPDIPYLDQSIKIELTYFLNYITIRMNRMVENNKIDFNARMREKVINTIKQLWQNVNEYKNQYCVSHSDLSLSNILVNDKHVTVLDFHSSEINSPFKDLSRLYHQLFLFSFKPVYQKNIIRHLQRALLSGWGNPKADENPLFRIYYLMHLMNHLGKISRYWEHNFIENIYNCFVVKKSLQHLKEFIAYESEPKN